MPWLFRMGSADTRRAGKGGRGNRVFKRIIDDFIYVVLNEQEEQKLYK